MGDLNAHNPQWGSDTITDKGKKFEDVILHLNLCILVVQTHIYMYILAMVLTPQLILLLYHYSDLIWSVHEDLCGSDHFPIFVRTNDRFENDSVTNWNF